MDAPREIDATRDTHVLDRVWATVAARRGADPTESYAAFLLARHPVKPAQKLAEEAAEVAIEAVAGRRDGVIRESADLVFHLVVLLTGAGVSRDEVYGEIALRMRASADRDGRRPPKEIRRIVGTTKLP